MNTDGKDVSVGIEDIIVIRIVKKSKAGPGAGIGLLIGGGLGALAGLAMGGNSDIVVVALAVIFGLLGISAGALTGGAAGKDEIIRIEGMPDSRISAVLQELCKKARVRDYK